MMKWSKYNFIWELPDSNKILIYNSLTGSLADFPSDNRDIFNDASFLKKGDEQLINDLTQGGFLVEDTTDELKIIEFLYNSYKYSNATKDITIAPTLECNFNCIYCYEQGKSFTVQSAMSMDTQNELVELFKRESKKNYLISITWFGGEPLLEKEIIQNLSKRFLNIARNQGTVFSASLITNGFLFTINEKTLNMLKECNISEIQITLDGPPKIHNQRRKLIDSDIGTFKTILKNVCFLYNNGININLRINIDNNNKDSITDLLHILKRQNLMDVPISLGHIQVDTQGCKFYEVNCLTTKQFGEIQREYYNLLANQGFKKNNDFPYPRLGQPCVANRINSIIIDPEGGLYKCRADIGNKDETIGNIHHLNNRSNYSLNKEIKWITWSPLKIKNCRKCKLLPICLGGCAHRSIFDNKTDCSEWKFNLEFFIKHKYFINTR